MGSGQSAQTETELKAETDKAADELAELVHGIVKEARREELKKSMQMKGDMIKQMIEEIKETETQKNLSETQKEALMNTKSQLETEIKECETEISSKDLERVELYAAIAVEEQIMKKFADQHGDKKSKLIVAVGQVGDGKSTFCNRLGGDLTTVLATDGKFKVENGSGQSSHKSVTSEISFVTTTYERDDQKKEYFTIVDTPGARDADEKDEQNEMQLIRFLRGCNGVNAFLMFYNMASPRFCKNYKDTIRKYEEILGKGVWKHVIIIATKVDGFIATKTSTPIDWEKEKESLRNRIFEEMELKEVFGDENVKLPVVFACGTNQPWFQAMPGFTKDFFPEGAVKKVFALVPDETYNCDAIRCRLDELTEKKAQLEVEMSTMREKLQRRRASLTRAEVGLENISSKTEELEQVEEKLVGKANTVTKYIARDIANMLGLMDPAAVRRVLAGAEGVEDEQQSKELRNEKDDVLPCPKCATPLKYREAQTAYGLLLDMGQFAVGVGGSVLCDECGEKIGQTDYVYHCPKGKIDKHENGYDMCDKCANKILGGPGVAQPLENEPGAQPADANK